MMWRMTGPGGGAGNEPGVSEIAVAGSETGSGFAGGGVDTDPRQCWARTRARLKRDLGEQVFTSWFASMELEDLEAGTARMSVATRFLKSWIDQHYRDRLTDLWRVERHDVGRVEVTVRVPHGAARPVMAAAPRGRNPDPAPAPVAAVVHHATTAEENFGSPLDRRLTFATFMVGRTNELAHAAARKVASATEAPGFNPLFLHASVGLGKTHLLQAVAHQARNAGRRVLYLTAERFMYGFVAALKAGGAIAFKEHLRGIDVLAIDDVQFLQGRHVQAEFGHTLNALLDGARQVVVAGDRPPADLEMLDDRMKSRLAGGLVAELGPLDEDLRLKVLRTKIEAAKERSPGLVIPESVVGYVARAIQSNARDIDGALHRLVAMNELRREPLTVDAAEACLRDLVRMPEPKKVRIEDIQRIVAKHYNVSRQDIVSSRRTQAVVMPRQVAMYLSKVLTPRSLPEIGRRFGGRDHTTVLYAVRKIEDLLKTDAALAQDVELLKRMLLEA